MKQLSPKALEYIAKTYGKKMAEGGDISDEDALLNSAAVPEETSSQPNASTDSEESEQPAAATTTPPPGYDGSPEANPNIPIPPDPSAAPAQTAPLPASVSVPSYAQAFQAEKEANLAKAQAETTQGNQEVAAINQGQAKIDQLPTANDFAQAEDQKLNTLKQAYDTNKLDPNHYWNNLSTGQKITSGIALILGGIGSGLTHQPNLAATMMDNAINRDIEAQKNSQDKQMNLFTMNRQQYGDDQSANLATKNQILVGVQSQLQKAASAAKGPMAQANAQGLNAIIDREMAKNTALLGLHAGLTGQTQESSTEQGFVNNLNTAQVLAPEMAKAAQEKYIPSVGIARVPVTPADKDSVMALTDLNNNIDKAIELQKNFGLTGSWSPTARAQSREIQSELNVSLNQLFNLKRLTPIEYDNFKTQIGNIGGINIGGTMEGLLQLKANAASKRAVQFDQLGITPFKQPIAPASQAFQNRAAANPNAAKIKIQNGHRYTLNPQTGNYE